MSLICYTSLNFNVYVLLHRDSVPKQKAIHSSMAYSVHVVLLNALQADLCVNASQAKINSNFNCYVALFNKMSFLKHHLRFSRHS
jgi:hypothetical protein